MGWKPAVPAPFRMENGAVKSCKGSTSQGAFVTKGRKYDKEDPTKDSEDHILCGDGMGDSKVAVICDGHGGVACSRFCAQALMCARSAISYSHDLFVRSFMTAEEQWHASLEAESDNSGTTATLAVATKNAIHIGHVGDSLACKVRADASGHLLGKAHVASDAEEAAAVLARDPRAFVSTNSGTDDVPRVNGVIEVTRALGDAQDKPALSAVPDYITVPRASDQVLLVVATDGLWGTLTPDTVGKFAKEAVVRGDCMADVAESLARKAFARGSADDIGVYVLHLGGTFDPAPPKTIVAAPATVDAPGPDPPTLVPLPAQLAPPPPLVPADGGDRAPVPVAVSTLPLLTTPGDPEPTAAVSGRPFARITDELIAEMPRRPRVSAGLHGFSGGVDAFAAHTEGIAMRVSGPGGYTRQVSQTQVTLADAVAAEDTPPVDTAVPTRKLADGDFHGGASSRDPRRGGTVEKVHDGAAAAAHSAVRAGNSWGLGRVVRWGLLLAAAATGVAVIAAHRRRRG
eukprot:jgi/Ulvmu1/7102/UM034_0006.1